jgi:Tfp pilus assembly protein PilP
MKLNLAFLLLMSSMAVTQTPSVTEKPTAKPSAATVKAVATTSAKPQATSVKVSTLPTQKPATVSVQPTPAKVSVPAKVSAQAPAKVSVQAAPAKSVPVASTKSTPAKPTPVAIAPAKPGAPAATSGHSSPAVVSVKPAVTPATAAVVSAKGAQAGMKKAAEVKVPATTQAHSADKSKASATSHTTVAVHDTKTAEGEKKQPSKTFSATGHRDPFLSPVVKLGTTGSGCSTGKRCLAIDQIALKGVVKSDVGMIAVVVNAMNKAYFLRENDPVFNGYVTKITGDSIVFKETFHDRLGKSSTRDVTKTISRPAV